MFDFESTLIKPLILTSLTKILDGYKNVLLNRRHDNQDITKRKTHLNVGKYQHYRLDL